MKITTFNLRNFFDVGPRNTYGETIMVTEEFVGKVLANTVNTVRALMPDILVTQEVGSPRLFNELASLVGAMGEYRTFLADPDKRGIANGVLLRGEATFQSLSDTEGFPVFREDDADTLGARMSPHRAFTCCELVYRGKPLTIIGVHLKASSPIALLRATGEKHPIVTQHDAGDALIRALIYKMSQARRLRTLVDMLFIKDPKAQIIVLGDFNAEGYAEALRVIKGEMKEGSSQLSDVCDHVPEERRYSFIGRRGKSLIDHILISSALRESVVSVEIRNEHIVDQTQQPEDHFFESDHAPITLTLA